MKPLDTLISALASDDPVVAGDAARLLGELNDQRAIPALLKYGKRARHHYKSAGLWALGLLGKSAEARTRDEVAATLRELVANPNVHDDWYWYSCRGVRASAALALLMLADESAVPYLRELADKNDDVFFCWFGPALLRLEKNCPAVAELQSRLTVAELLNTEKRKTRDSEPGLVTMKAQVLGILKGPEACAALENLAKFHSRYVRGQAALSLLEASDAPAHLGLVEAMADADATDFARLKACLALALKGQAQRGDEIAKLAGSAADPFDRAVAIESLGLLRRKKDAAVIRRQIARGDAYLRQCALEALERIDPETAVETAEKMLRDESPRVRHQAAKVLAAHGTGKTPQTRTPRQSKAVRTTRAKAKRPIRKASPAGARK
jgi:HEAT repeat protein